MSSETTSLYEALGVAADTLTADKGRTHRTAQVETIDRDRTSDDLRRGRGFGRRGDRSPLGGGAGRVASPPRPALQAVSDMYIALSRPAADPVAPGRTYETKTIETIDRDRAGIDLIAPIGSRERIDRGRTAITEATETIDRDRPPDR